MNCFFGFDNYSRNMIMVVTCAVSHCIGGALAKHLVRVHSVSVLAFSGVMH